MTKARTAYIYQFQGAIQTKTLHQASPKSKYANQPYYKLRTQLENQPNKVLQVFKDKLINPAIWEAIEQSRCFKRKYLFSCRNSRGYYYLVD
jgi:hypothetical protein